MPTKPDGEEPKIVKGLALDPRRWDSLDAIARKYKISRNQLLEIIILSWIENDQTLVDLEEKLSQGVLLTPLQREVWEVYKNNNNRIKPTAKQLGRQPEQIRSIVARTKKCLPHVAGGSMREAEGFIQKGIQTPPD